MSFKQTAILSTIVNVILVFVFRVVNAIALPLILTDNRGLNFDSNDIINLIFTEIFGYGISVFIIMQLGFVLIFNVGTIIYLLLKRKKKKNAASFIYSQNILVVFCLVLYFFGLSITLL